MPKYQLDTLPDQRMIQPLVQSFPRQEVALFCLRELEQLIAADRTHRWLPPRPPAVSGAANGSRK